MARIVELEEKADQKQRASDDDRWEAARLIVEDLDATGKSMRALAREIGRSHTHVRRMAGVWRNRNELRGRHTFGSLYSSALTTEPPRPSRLAWDDGPADRGDFGGADDEDWKPSSSVRRHRAWPALVEALKTAHFAAGLDPTFLEDGDADVVIRHLERTIPRLQGLLRSLKEQDAFERVSTDLSEDAPF